MRQKTPQNKQFEIWNHKENWMANSGFNSVADAWAHVRAFYNIDDYEVRPQSPTRPMEGKPKRPVGRPPSGLPPRKREFLQVERSPELDSCLLQVRKILATQDGCSIEDIAQSKAIRYALYMVANRLPVK